MNAKQKYQKKYKQRDGVKTANAEFMREYYATPEGKAYEYKKSRYPRSRFVRGRGNALRRKKEFTLTFEEYSALIANPCAYCDKSIAGESGLGLDRLDNQLGYVQGNCAPCCSSCNRRRAKSMAADEFKKQTKLNNY